MVRLYGVYIPMKLRDEIISSIRSMEQIRLQTIA